MDRIEYFRAAIKSVLRGYASLFSHKPQGIDVIAVCDDVTQTYAIINLVWEENRRINITSVLMRIVNEKIWVEADAYRVDLS